jgi:3,4-dihydroxy-2-butanone 4-phosphate synthase
MMFAKIEAAIGAIAAGEMIIVVDDPGRENEGNLIMAAEPATPEKLAFMINHTSGVVCVGMPGDRLDELRLPLMVAENSDSMHTAFTVTVDYKVGTTTGISAADRAATIKALVTPSMTANDFSRPGHVFPLRAANGGTLCRRGHTEAAVDLTQLAGLSSGGVLCEIVNRDGTMARGFELERFARAHGLMIVSIADLVAYRECSPITLPNDPVYSEAA